MTRGVFIVFCGINGSGKTTLINKLLYKLNSDENNKNNIKTSIILWTSTKCPNRDTPIGKKIDNILKGTLIVDKHTEIKFFSENRKEIVNNILYNLNQGINVICDRYLYCNVAYTLTNQTTQLLNLNKTRLFNVANIISYDKGIIKPDCVILLLGDFLHLRNEKKEKYHISNEIFNNLLINNYIISFLHTNSNFIIIENKKDELNKTVNDIIIHINKIKEEYQYKQLDRIQ